MKMKYAYFFIPLLVIIGGYYLWEGRQGGHEKGGGKEPPPTIDISQAANIKIDRSSNESIVMAKTDDGWFINSPISSLADGETVEKIVSGLSGIKINRKLGVLTDDKKPEYGLDKPSYSIWIADKGGNPIADLKLGAENPAGDGRYASRGDGELLLLATDGLEFTKTSLADIRSNAITGIQADAVMAIEFSTGEIEYVINRNGESWQMTSPEQASVSSSWVDGLLTIISRAKAEEFIPNPSLQDYTPLKGGIILKGDKGAKHEIDFLGLDKAKGILAKSSDLPEPFLTEFRLADYINVTPDALRETRLIIPPKKMFSSVTFREVGGTNMEFEVRGEDFVITKPPGREAVEKVAFKEFFMKLFDLKALRYLEADTPLRTLGLEPYKYKVEMKEENGKTLELYLGDRISDGYYARTGDNTKPMVVDVEQVRAFLDAVKVLRGE